jgi:hypothetical protein
MTDLVTNARPTPHHPNLPSDLPFSVHKFPHLLLAGLRLSPVGRVGFGGLHEAIVDVLLRKA